MIGFFAFFLLSGPKTELMLDALNQGILSDYREENHTFCYLGTSYTILTREITTFTKEPLVSIGASPLEREIILFDPNHSPYLEERYREFLLQNQFSFEAVAYFISHCIFTLSLSDKANSSTSILSLDQFVEAKTGVCRHFALVTAYFLDRLSQEGKIPKGKSHYMRDLVLTPYGYRSHAWNLFIIEEKSEIWHIDTLYGIIKKIETL